MKRLFFFFMFFIFFTVTCYGMLSYKEMDTSSLMSSIPEDIDNQYGLISYGSTSENRAYPLQRILSETSLDTTDNMLEEFTYVYDDSIAEKLDLKLYMELEEDTVILEQYSFHNSMSEEEKYLNQSLASIYSRYLKKTNIPLQDPLWLIALGSVEYNYSNNPSGVIFSFPIDLNKASGDPNYLLSYDWTEVQRQEGNSAVLRRDGSSIGIFQITSGYGVNVDPVIPEEFGIIGSEKQRSDCWLSLGERPDSGDSIIWKPGVNGDRWSPADNANIIYAVYDSFLKQHPLSDKIDSKYEKAILLMWAHNRGVGIMDDEYYIEKTKQLAHYVPELKAFIEALKPVRFSRNSILRQKYESISSSATGGDNYPVMALMSYLITEYRYSGEW
mgnify:CR=1 FL=1